MGKYIVTSGSYFQPFTYDELVKPLQQMTDTWNQTQDAYDVMNLESSMLDQFINNEDDPLARQKYESYMKNLKTLQDDLWANGINARTRKYLSDARIGYARDIKGLQTAIQNRNERSKAYWDAYHNNPDTIMGMDPGKASLDRYLENSNYGTDWFSYSGKQFMQEIAAEVQARAKEYQKTSYAKEVPGYITRIIDGNISNDDINTALSAVRNGTVDSLEGAPKLLADVLVSKINATGAQKGVNITPEQYDRFIDYAGTGMASTIKEPERKDLEDVVERQRISDASWSWRNSITHRQAMEAAEREQQNKLALERIKQGDNSAGSFDDTLTIKGPEENYAKARKQVTSDVGGDFTNIVITKDKRRLKSNAEASSLVYGEDIRREAYEPLGFDIGLSKEKYMQGKGRYNGHEYYTKYDNGKILISNDGRNWGVSKNLTNYYNAEKKKYDDNLRYYKTKEKDIYKLALTDPDEQRKMYEREGLDFASTPLADYASTVMTKAGNHKETTWTSSKVATRGTDNGGYIGKVADRIYGSLLKNKKGEVTIGAQKDWRRNTGLGSGIHELSSIGTIAMKPVANPNDVFKIDKDKKVITNIDQIRVDADGIRKGYIIVHLSDKNKEYAVGIDMLRSDTLLLNFERFANDLNNIGKFEPGLKYEDRRAKENAIVNYASKSIRDVLGYKDATIDGASSSKENIN